MVDGIQDIILYKTIKYNIRNIGEKTQIIDSKKEIHV